MCGLNTKICVVILMIVMLLSPSMTVFAETDENQTIMSEKEVLILNGFQYGLPVADIYTKSIVDTLRAAGIPVSNIFVEYLDLNRKDNDSQRLFMQERLLELSINHSIEIIIAMDQVAADFIVHECKDLFEGVPLIVSYDEEPIWEGPPRDLIIAAASNDAKGTVRYAFELFPSTQNVVLIEGKGDEKDPFIERLITAIEATDQRITIERTNNLPYSEMLERIVVLPPDTIAFYGSYFQDIANETFVPAAVANTVSRTANVPVFAFIDMHIKNGLVGGSVVINEKLGQQVAKVALDYFSGTLLLTDEPTRVYPDFYALFDWQQLKRWSADTTILPDETVFLNYTPTLWETHRELILATSLSIVALILLVVLLFITSKKQRITLERLHESEYELQKNKEYLNNLIRYAKASIITWSPDYKITEFNRAFEKLTGRTREEVLGQHLEIIFPDDSRLGSMNHIYKTVTGEFWEAVDIPITHKSGKVHSVLWSSANIKNPEGKLIATIAQGQDITERKQAEFKLAESEVLLSRSQELAHIGSWNLDLTTNKLYWSDETYRIFGFKPQEFTPTYEAFLIFIYPDDRIAVEEAYSRSVRGKSDSYEIEHRILRQSTGEIRHVYERCVHVRDDAGDIIQSIGIVQDITERKATEAEQRRLLEQVQRDRRVLVSTLEDQRFAEMSLRDSEERMRLATEQSNVAVWEYDFNTNSMNRSANHDGLYGMARQERWDITTFQNATHPDDREYSNQFIQNSVAPGGSDEYAFDFRVVLPDTTIRWLSVYGRVIERNENGQGIRVRGIITDITQRKLAEESLKTYADRLMNQHRIDQAILQAIDSPEKITQEAVKHLRDLLQSQRVSVGIFAFDKKEVSIFAASGDDDSVVQVGQVLPEELYGEMDILQENKLEIIEDSLKMETDSSILRTIRAEGVLSSINAPIGSPKGLVGALSIGWETARTITSEEQEIASEVASQIAIAIEQARLLQESKRHAEELEEKINRRTAQLEAKTRELETFTYSVAHDLKAPLRGIDGYSRLLLEDYNDRLDEEGRQFLNTIRQSAERMNQLIEDLLAYSRLERRPAQEHPYNLRMLAQTAVTEFEVEIRKRSGTVNMNVPDIVVNVDPEGMAIALRNLLDNALKYTPFTQQPAIEICAQKGEKTVVLWIRDNGIGFDMKYHDRIFGIFNRLHRSEEYPGTGIGLAMVRKALERMGGRVWAESQPEKGATFYIEISLTKNEGIRSNNERS